MKLFYKKDYLETKSLLNYEKQKRLEEQDKHKEEIIKKTTDCEAKIHNLKTDYEAKIHNLRIDLLHVKSSNGGLTIKIKRLTEEKEALKKEKEALKKELDELKSSSYIIKKVRSGRVPKRQQMGIKKSASTIPSVRKYMKKELDK